MNRLLRRLFVFLAFALILAIGLPIGPPSARPGSFLRGPIRLQATTWALVTNQAIQGSGTTAGPTTGVNTNGSTLIVLIAVGSNSAGPVVSDNQSNLWNRYQGTTNNGGNAMTIFWCSNPVTNASHTFTETGPTFPSLAMLAFSGTVANVGLQLTTATGTGNVALASVTPSANNSLLVSGFNGSGSATETVNAGFTITNQIGGSTGNRVAGAYLIQTSAAAAALTWTVASGTNTAALLVFQSANASSGETSSVFGSGS